MKDRFLFLVFTTAAANYGCFGEYDARDPLIWNSKFSVRQSIKAVALLLFAWPRRSLDLQDTLVISYDCLKIR